ncbi:MAG TPA: PEP-CTERM sorting domain-containing protein [Tepidisphaeraceae bacterium]|jgi:hypothetical protein
MHQKRYWLGNCAFTYIHSRRMWLAASIALVCAGSQIAQADSYNDGGTHTINTAVSGTVGVGPTSGTTVNIVQGAQIVGGGGAVGTSVDILGGTVNVSGGAVTAANTPSGVASESSAIYFDNIGVGGVLNISGGTVSAGSTNGPPNVSEAIEVNNSAAQINISGGLVTSGTTGTGDINLLFAGDILTVTGGTIQSNTNASAIFSRGLVDIYAGTIQTDGTAILNQGGTVKIYGGTITGTGNGEINNEIGTIDIYGTSFNYPFGPISADLGSLVGTLSNGSPIDTTFDRADSAPIVLIRLPEPGSLALIALGCGLLLRRKAVKALPSL